MTPTDQVAGIFAEHRDQEPFSTLEHAAAEAMRAALSLVELSAGRHLFCQGDEDGSLYVLVRGKVDILVADDHGATTSVNQLGPGQTVGEMALVSGQPRSASAVALSDALLLQLTRQGFDQLCGQHPDDMRRFVLAVMPRIREAQLHGPLRGLVGDQDVETINELAAQLGWVSLVRGEDLIRQGEQADCMFLIIQGRLRIIVHDEDGTERPIHDIGRGETVGEFQLLTGEPRSATVRAVRDSAVLKITSEQFEQLRQRFPRAMMRLARIAFRRVQQQSARSRSGASATTVAIFPITPDLPLNDFAERLTRSLQLTGPTVRLDSEGLDRRFNRPGLAQTGSDHPADVMLNSWLSDQELNVRYVVYQGDPSPSPWSERCMRQADRVLLLADGRAFCRSHAFDELLGRWQAHTRIELVLLQPEQITRPSDTATWLDHHQVQAHHHIRPRRDADIQRLARQLTGRAVGLVLSGGAARGFAHIGVLRALEEANIQADMLAGTSMGAVVGAMAALGADNRVLVETAKKFSSPIAVFDVTLPLVSLLASKKVNRIFQGMYGDTQIEDLWQPFFCVSACLTSAKAVVHRRGPLWQAVRASTAIPGVFSPVPYDGSLLVDGGLLNNMPTDLMIEQSGGGTFIAVDVTPEFDMVGDYTVGHHVSGWRALARRLNPLVPNPVLPTILNSIARAVLLPAVHHVHTTGSLADLTIRPDTARFDLMDFTAYAAIIEAGYRATNEALTSWRLPSAEA